MTQWNCGRKTTRSYRLLGWSEAGLKLESRCLVRRQKRLTTVNRRDSSPTPSHRRCIGRRSLQYFLTLSQLALLQLMKCKGQEHVSQSIWYITCKDP